MSDLAEEVTGTDHEPTNDRPSRVAPWIALAIAIAMIGLVVVLIGADPDDGAPTADTPLLGRPAPEAIGVLDDGSNFDLARRKGSWVVLNFFRSDCVPCIQEHPELIEFVDQQQTLGTDGAEFYSIVNGDTPERVERFFAERGGDWPIVYSDNDEFSVAFGVAAVPETWIIDPNGVVRLRLISRVSADTLSVTLQQLRESA
jgi:cytochrome c biogenesis protein CcmG/thiol:disulfide interchange protein DsbE